MRKALLDPLFLVLVVLPTLLASLYFGVLASDVFVSESRFIVRSPDRTRLPALGAVLSSGSLAGPSDESEAVSEFILSRAGLAALEADGLARRAFGDPQVFALDRFGSFGRDTDEHLFRFYLGKVAVEQTAASQVTRLVVRAFSPQQAQAMNERLLEHAEALVNALSERARRDAIGFAEEEVERARAHAREAALALAAFRDREGVIDPQLQAEAKLQMIGRLQDELIAARTRLLQMRTYTPDASQLPFLETQVRELEREIARQTGSIAGGNRSLSAAAARYQELQLASQFAEQQLAVALASLQEAQAEARRKQAYVERIAEPSLADYPVSPRRLRGILATLVLGLVAWGVVSMLVAGVREHRD